MKRFILILVLFPFAAIAQAPANDLICAAITIPVVSGTSCPSPAIYQWDNATYDPSGTSNPNCGWTASNKDVWYKFTPASSNSAILFSQAYDVSHNLAAAIYEGESCSFLYSFTVCDDNNGPDDYPQLTSFDMIPGTTYFLRVWQVDASIDSGSARICIVNEPLAPAGSKLGVGTSFPSAVLDVNGTMKIRGGLPGINKILTSDAYGNASWKTPAVPLQTAFGIYVLPGTAPSIPSSVFTKIAFAQPEETGVTNISAGVFTAPETAVYHFDAAVTFPVNAGISVSARIVIRNAGTIVSSYETRDNTSQASSEKTLTISATAKLTVGYTAEVQFFHNTGAAITLNSTGTLGVDRKTRFQGYKVF